MSNPTYTQHDVDRTNRLKDKKDTQVSNAYCQQLLKLTFIILGKNLL